MSVSVSQETEERNEERVDIQKRESGQVTQRGSRKAKAVLLDEAASITKLSTRSTSTFIEATTSVCTGENEQLVVFKFLERSFFQKTLTNDATTAAMVPN